MKSKVIVVSHKEFVMPNDNAYIPFYVGEIANKKDQASNLLKDGVGENIASKNPNFCELTAQYWLWKNESDVDIKGLVHYRRHLMSLKNKSNNKLEKVLTGNEIEEILRKVDCILPKKRNYYIENTYSHYKNAHNIEDLEETKQIISEKYPEYLESFDKVMLEKKSHRFNMLIAKKEIFDDYSNWLFTILFELEKRVDISEYDDYQKRIFGFISERLLDVWMEYNQVNYREVPCMFMEKQKWINKASNFIYRKFKG